MWSSSLLSREICLLALCIKFCQILFHWVEGYPLLRSWSRSFEQTLSDGTAAAFCQSLALFIALVNSVLLEAPLMDSIWHWQRPLILFFSLFKTRMIILVFTIGQQLQLVSKELRHCWTNGRISSPPWDLLVGFFPHQSAKSEWPCNVRDPDSASSFGIARPLRSQEVL